MVSAKDWMWLAIWRALFRARPRAAGGTCCDAQRKRSASSHKVPGTRRATHVARRVRPKRVVPLFRRLLQLRQLGGFAEPGVQQRQGQGLDLAGQVEKKASRHGLGIIPMRNLELIVLARVQDLRQGSNLCVRTRTTHHAPARRRTSSRLGLGVRRTDIPEATGVAATRGMLCTSTGPVLSGRTLGFHRPEPGFDGGAFPRDFR